MAKSNIPYCDETWEVTGGCTKCEDGCLNCWALKNVWRMAHRTGLKEKWGGLVEKTAAGLNWTGKIKCFEDVLDIPPRRKKPTTYFVDSKADLFHEKVPFDYRLKVWRRMSKCPQHIFQMLTKRADIMKHFVGEWLAALDGKVSFPVSLPNVWLGVSCENQKTADERIPQLLQIPAAVRWVSFEPLIGPIYDIDFEGISWAVIGCESINGKPGRGCGGDALWWSWAENIAEQLRAGRKKFFMKQGPINGKVVRDINQFPKDLQVQDYPE